MRFLSSILMLGICFFVGVFMMRNTQTVWVNYFWREGEVPVWSVVIVSLIVGMFIALLIQVVDQAGQAKQQRRLKKENERLLKEIQNLKNS